MSNMSDSLLRREGVYSYRMILWSEIPRSITGVYVVRSDILVSRKEDDQYFDTP